MSDNKKYYYLKLKENFFDTDEMIVLESMQDGYLYSNILLKLYLRSLKHDGRLMFNDRIPFNAQMLAKVTRHPVGVVQAAMDLFKNLGLVEILDNGAIYLADIQNFIGESSTEADRIRSHRKRIETEKLSLTSNTGVQMYDKCTPKIEIEKEIEIDKELKEDGKKKRKTDISLDQYNLGESLDYAIRDFIENRKQLKAPMTQRALDIMIKKLFEMTNTESEMIAILEQSITSGYKGIFPVKKQSVSKGEENIRRIMDL